MKRRRRLIHVISNCTKTYLAAVAVAPHVCAVDVIAEEHQCKTGNFFGNVRFFLFPTRSRETSYLSKYILMTRGSGVKGNFVKIFGGNGKVAWHNL